MEDTAAGTWLLDEVEEMVRREMELCHLMDKKSVLAQEVNQLNQRLEAGDRHWTLTISDLERLIGVRNTQIADLQQKLIESEGRLKRQIDAITTMVDAKCAINVLMSELVSAKTAAAKQERELRQEKGSSKQLRRLLVYERDEHQQQLVELKRRHRDKVFYLLNQPHSSEEELLQRLRIQETEELDVVLHLAKKGIKLAKVSEQQRQKVQELEIDIRAMKKKLLKHSNVLESNKLYAEKVGSLEEEIKALKKQNMELRRQMREKSLEFQKKQSKKDRA